MIRLSTFINKYITADNANDKMVEAVLTLKPILDKIQIEDGDEHIKVLKCFHELYIGKHFDEFFAKEQVGKMYHTKTDGYICRGEIYSINIANCIHKKLKKTVNAHITCWDVYVAINAQYHDNAVEYMSWFKNIDREELDDKVLSSAINFWFEDEDAGNCKVWNYFKNIG